MKLEKRINNILDQQEFEVNEPVLNRDEIIEKIINLFDQRDKKFIKEIKRWVFDNHMHHNEGSEGEMIEPCQENDSPYVNSLELEKFIESDLIEKK